MSKKKKWDEFVQFVRGPQGPRIQKFMKETLEEDMDNFLFLANSEDPDGPIIRGMHYPDSDMLDEGVTVFETSEKKRIHRGLQEIFHAGNSANNFGEYSRKILRTGLGKSDGKFSCCRGREDCGRRCSQNILIFLS